MTNNAASSHAARVRAAIASNLVAVLFGAGPVDASLPYLTRWLVRGLSRCHGDRGKDWLQVSQKTQHCIGKAQAYTISEFCLRISGERASRQRRSSSPPSIHPPNRLEHRLSPLRRSQGNDSH
ncbi:hypothetical protein DFJ74DRAFT_657351 [Hyaloraphidium curvatum]|nr:hypothetical protein DFJ74DRAFT_657351 [Hyaloraphidium curvatum]